MEEYTKKLGFFSINTCGLESIRLYFSIKISYLSFLINFFRLQFSLDSINWAISQISTDSSKSLKMNFPSSTITPTLPSGFHVQYYFHSLLTILGSDSLYVKSSMTDSRVNTTLPTLGIYPSVIISCEYIIYDLFLANIIWQRWKVNVWIWLKSIFLKKIS